MINNECDFLIKNRNKIYPVSREMLEDEFNINLKNVSGFLAYFYAKRFELRKLHYHSAGGFWLL